MRFSERKKEGFLELLFFLVSTRVLGTLFFLAGKAEGYVYNAFEEKRITSEREHFGCVCVWGVNLVKVLWCSLLPGLLVFVFCED